MKKKIVTDAASDEKLKGRVYTPKFIVENILDLSSYYGQKILKKHVIDNSCGDGAFLVAIVKRYCEEFIKSGYDMTGLTQDLVTYIHGIEIDEAESEKCVRNLNKTIESYGLKNINWDINCADTLSVDKYNGKMDFVLGNPPYIRIHNLGSAFGDVKKFSFAQSGMTDLYIVFYEIGLRMLNANGVLGYITPSSFFNSLAGKYMRSYLTSNNLIDIIVDLKHFQAFNATTYTTIVVLKKNKTNNTVNYFQFEHKNLIPYYVDTLNVDDFFINNKFFFANKEKLKELKNVLLFRASKEYFEVKNGFATLADKFFIGNFDFDAFTIPIIKASTGTRYRCIFPYLNGALVEYKKLTKNAEIKDYFERNKQDLIKRSLEEKGAWYGFGRSQGINDVYKSKYAINTLIKTIDDIKLVKCDKGVGVYGGLYILTEISENVLKELLYCEKFLTYISMLGKYKSGGYYTFSSKDLKNYLEYEYANRKGFYA